ncbi:tripartite tricarboxylate transporter TctB family protein [Georgenia yuyongxinii]
MAAPATTADKINVGVGAMIVVVAAVFWFQRSYTTAYGGTFADPVIIVLAVLGLVLLVLGLLRRPVGHGTEEEEKMPLRGLVIAVLLLTAWVAALPYLGYLVGGIIFFVLMAVLMRSGRPSLRGLLLDAAISVVIVASFYVIFTEVLYVRLPELAF